VLTGTLGVRILNGVKHRVPLFGRHLGPTAQVFRRPGQRCSPPQVDRLGVASVRQVALQ